MARVQRDEYAGQERAELLGVERQLELVLVAACIAILIVIAALTANGSSLGAFATAC